MKYLIIAITLISCVSCSKAKLENEPETLVAEPEAPAINPENTVIKTEGERIPAIEIGEEKKIPSPLENLKFCVYHYKKSINVYVYGFKDTGRENFNFNVTSPEFCENGHPLYIEFTVSEIRDGKGADVNEKESVSPDAESIKRYVLAIVPIKTEKIYYSKNNEEDVMEFVFEKTDDSEEMAETHVEFIHKLSFTIPNEDYDLWLVPDVLRKNEDGEYAFELKEALTLRTVPKMLSKN
ncbi:MAG: hypothetical protein ABID09_02995 [Candidatus Omnitrophota bacterium]